MRYKLFSKVSAGAFQQLGAIAALLIAAGLGATMAYAAFGGGTATSPATISQATISQATSPTPAQWGVVPRTREAIRQSFSPVVKRAAPAVVNVYVSSRVRTFASPFRNDPFFDFLFRGDRFGRPSERMQSSLGSGVIVSPDGVIVTNTHVIKARGETKIRVALADKREFDARLLSQDEKTDIAVLKIDNGNERFPYLEFDDSDQLEVGDLVLAIGNPFGVGQTVTSGIISATARSQLRSEAVFIQTDAAINPGNSGGALVDVDGRLVGINTAIFSRSGGSHGIGFAIPSNLVRLFVDSAVEGRKVERPWLGARLEKVDRDMASALGLSRIAGAVVTRVYGTGPANDAGLEPGDVIVKVGDFDVSDARSVQYRLTTMGVGRRATLRVIRKGRPMTLRIALRPAPKPGPRDIRDFSGKHPFSGARLANILPTIADELDLDTSEGAVVLSVERRSVAARLGFRAGDVVVETAGRQIADLDDLESALKRRPRVWNISIRRGGRLIETRIPGL
ncbi:MAG: Do family serine endopeptidase [Pseudomonadota bacterium]